MSTPDRSKPESPIPKSSPKPIPAPNRLADSFPTSPTGHARDMHGKLLTDLFDANNAQQRQTLLKELATGTTDKPESLAPVDPQHEDIFYLSPPPSPRK